MVGSQIANLTSDLSFGHNLCFKCPNEQCEPISEIYPSIAFQWYKELFKAMSFDPYNCTMKIWKSIWDSNSQHGSSLGSVRVHSLTLFALPEACEVTPESFSWPATLQPLALVVNPRLRLWQKGDDGFKKWNLLGIEGPNKTEKLKYLASCYTKFLKDSSPKDGVESVCEVHM
jgi:hypothetical protein